MNEWAKCSMTMLPAAECAYQGNARLLAACFESSKLLYQLLQSPLIFTAAAADLARYSPAFINCRMPVPGVPILVFLSPGVDVAASVEALGRKLGFTADAGKYASVSLGQGQEAIAMQKLESAHKLGGWVLLQNIHLTMDWTSGALEKAVDKLAAGAHPNFR